MAKEVWSLLFLWNAASEGLIERHSLALIFATAAVKTCHPFGRVES